jgi:hypothetical protein
LATTLSVLKGETSKLLKGERTHFWQARYYDSTSLPITSASRSSGISIATLSSGAWWQGLTTGLGVAFDTMLLGSLEESKSSRNGPGIGGSGWWTPPMRDETTHEWGTQCVSLQPHRVRAPQPKPKGCIVSGLLNNRAPFDFKGALH